MKFGILLEKVVGKIFGYRAIPDSFHEQRAGHFTKWLPEYASISAVMRVSLGRAVTE